MDPKKCWGTRFNRRGRIVTNESESSGSGRGGKFNPNANVFSNGGGFAETPQNKSVSSTVTSVYGGNRGGYRGRGGSSSARGSASTARGGYRGGGNPYGSHVTPMEVENVDDFVEFKEPMPPVKQEGKWQPHGNGSKYVTTPIKAFKLTPITATIQGAQQYSIYKGKMVSDIVFEVYAKLDSEPFLGMFDRLEFFLKDKTGRIKAFYYPIDEPFPTVKSDQWLKLTAVMRNWGFQVVGVKLSNAGEVLQSEQKVHDSQKYLKEKLAQNQII